MTDSTFSMLSVCLLVLWVPRGDYSSPYITMLNFRFKSRARGGTRIGLVELVGSKATPVVRISMLAGAVGLEDGLSGEGD